MYPIYKNTITKNTAPTVTINNTPPESRGDLKMQSLRQNKLTRKEQTKAKRTLSPERASLPEAQSQFKRIRSEHSTTENPALTVGINNTFVAPHQKTSEKIGLSLEKQTRKEKALTPSKALKLSKPALRAQLYLKGLINRLSLQTLRNFGSILGSGEPRLRLQLLPIAHEDLEVVRVMRRELVSSYAVSKKGITPEQYANKLDIANYAKNRLEQLEQENLHKKLVEKLNNSDESYQNRLKQLEQQIKQLHEETKQLYREIKRLEQENLHKKPVEKLNNSDESYQNRLKQLMQQRVLPVEEAVLNNSDESN